MVLNLNEEELPREKLISKGPENLTEVELLATLLRTGTKNKNVIELSRDILRIYPLNILTKKSYNELIKIKGINVSKATTLLASFELLKRVNNKDKVRIKNTLSLFNYVKFDFLNEAREKLIVVFVDSKNYVIKKEVLFKGSKTSLQIDKKIILKKCFEYEAEGFFIIHNHFGDVNPSVNDIEVTKDFLEYFSNLEIKFLDHLIVETDNYSSVFDFF